MFDPFCPRNTPGLPPGRLLECRCQLPAVLGPLLLAGQEAAPSLQPHPPLSPGDVGSFMVKLVEGLEGQTWASDWAEELREADRQKEQTFRWGLAGVDGGVGLWVPGRLCRGPC